MINMGISRCFESTRSKLTFAADLSSLLKSPLVSSQMSASSSDSDVERFGLMTIKYQQCYWLQRTAQCIVFGFTMATNTTKF